MKEVDLEWQFKLLFEFDEIPYHMEVLDLPKYKPIFWEFYLRGFQLAKEQVRKQLGEKGVEECFGN